MAEQDFAAIGRIVAERKQLSERIELLRKQLKDSGQLLTQLGNALLRNAEHVVFMGQSVSMEYGMGNRPHFSVSDDLVPSLKQTVAELRGEVDKLKEVERKAQHYGI